MKVYQSLQDFKKGHEMPQVISLSRRALPQPQFGITGYVIRRDDEDCVSVALNYRQSSGTWEVWEHDGEKFVLMPIGTRYKDVTAYLKVGYGILLVD